jgi:hypothetical protein
VHEARQRPLDQPPDEEPFRTKHEEAFTELIAAYDDWKNLRFVLDLASALERNADLEEYRDQLHKTTSELSDDTIRKYVDESEEDPRAPFNRFFIWPLKDADPPKIGWIIIDGLDEALEVDGRSVRGRELRFDPRDRNGPRRCVFRFEDADLFDIRILGGSRQHR